LGCRWQVGDVPVPQETQGGLLYGRNGAAWLVGPAVRFDEAD
jgi:hypothetical protein